MPPQNTVCKHYTWYRHEVCAAGVAYADVLREHEPMVNPAGREMTISYPCNSRFNMGGARCPRRELPSEAEFAAEQARLEAARAERRLARAWERLGRGYGLAAEAVYCRRFPPKDFTLSDLGVRGTTPIHVRQNGDGSWEVRCGMAIMGSAAETTTWESDPFSEGFRDNYLVGKGITEEAALDDLREEGRKMSQMLFI
jgi:hypothetical protein